MTRALTMSGGGSKGAFSVGVLRHLVKTKNLTFDMISGVSVGAVMGPLVWLDRFDELEALFRGVESADVFVQLDAVRWSTVGALHSSEPLAGLIAKYIDADVYDAMQASPRPFVIGTFCLETKRMVYWYTGTKVLESRDPYRSMVKISSLAELRAAILASCNQPVFMPAVRMRSKHYVDGGLSDTLPGEVCCWNGATELFALAVDPPREGLADAVSTRKLMDVACAAFGYFVYDAADRSIGRTLALCGDDGIKMHLFRPSRDLPVRSALRFDPDEAADLITDGERLAQTVLP